MKSKLIGNNIRRRRKELKMTQSQLAESAHISDVHISHIETGKTTLSVDTLIAICDALSATPNDLLLGEYFCIVPQSENSFFEYSDELNYDDKILLQGIAQLLRERQ